MGDPLPQTVAQHLANMGTGELATLVQNWEAPPAFPGRLPTPPQSAETEYFMIGQPTAEEELSHLVPSLQAIIQHPGANTDTQTLVHSLMEHLQAPLQDGDGSGQPEQE